MKGRILIGMGLLLCLAASAAVAGPFADVPRGHPAYDSLKYLAGKGLLEGSATKFSPGTLLTRYEFAVATREVLDQVAHLVELAPAMAEGTLTGTPVSPAERRRIGEEVTRLMKEFQEELLLLEVNLERGRQHLRSFVETVRFVPGPEAPLRAWSLPGQRPPEADGTGNLPSSSSTLRNSPSLVAGLTQQEREALQLQPLFMGQGREVFHPDSPDRDLLARPDFSRYILAPQVGREAFFDVPGGLRLNASLGATTLQFVSAAQTQDEYAPEAYRLGGVRATIPMLGGTAGLAYLKAQTEDEVARTAREFAEGQVLGADVQFQVGRYGLYLEYARSELEDMRGRPMRGGPGSAFEAGIHRRLVPSLTVGAAYRSVDPSFLAPGFWGALGQKINPTDIRGFRVMGAYRPNEMLRFLSSYEQYTPISQPSSEVIGRTLTNLEYGLNNRAMLRVGYEFIRRRRTTRVFDDTEHYFTAGLNYDLADNVAFRLSYRRNVTDNPLESRSTQDDVAVSEFTISF